MFSVSSVVKKAPGTEIEANFKFHLSTGEYYDSAVIEAEDTSQCTKHQRFSSDNAVEQGALNLGPQCEQGAFSPEGS